MIVTRGTIRLTLGRKSRDFAEGDAIIIPPGTRFSGEGTREDTSIWVLHYEPMEKRTRPKVFRRGAAGRFARELLTEISYVARQGRKNARYLDLLGAALLGLLEAWPSLPRPTDIQPGRLLPEGGEPRKVREMARRAGLSESHYRAEFHRATGLSPRAYLRQTKAEKAQHLLRETRRPIKEIAQEVGYKDVVSFHRAFTAYCGCTPARFRREVPPAA
jgi:AraC-like DNA-binding protein